MPIPTDPETLLTRDATAAALTESGFPVASTTLATKATRGGGPPFQKFGTRPLYRWADALEWAQSKLSPVVTSTAELENKPSVRRLSMSPTQASAADRAADEQPSGVASIEPALKLGLLPPVAVLRRIVVPARVK
jgi:hypothetical protein